MGEHLTALDATFLELEEADESAHMHIGAIMVFDPRPDAGPPSVQELGKHLEARLGVLPRYVQRLSEPHTGGLSWPEWEDDPTFDIARHVSRAAIPAPGTDRELQAWASDFFSQRLDRHRPLWEMVIVEGLEDGRWALASKSHHCMVDGVSSVDVGHLLLDTTARPRRTRISKGSPAGEPSGEDAGGSPGALASLLHSWADALPVDTVREASKYGAHAVAHPREALRGARSALEVIVRDELHGAPHTSLNEPIGTLRRFAVMRVELAALREIKRRLGGTINDVVLTIVGSGTRELLLSRGENLPAEGLRVMVPVNVRAASEHLALGNRVSSLFVELPVAQPDLLSRYRETVEGSLALKAGGRQAAGTSAVIELAGLAPPVIHATLAQSLYATRLFNLTITNVPGPQQTLYAFGAPLREIHPLVPLAASHALGVAVVSYDSSMFFGVVADRDSVEDLDVLLDAMAAASEELLDAARDGDRSRAAAAASAS